MPSITRRIPQRLVHLGAHQRRCIHHIRHFSVTDTFSEDFPPDFERRSVIRKPNSVAILGGGISGLSAAFYLSKLDRNLPITIFEKSKRLGGWIRSERVKTEDGTTVTFETGPRTLRPWTTTGLVTIDMIRDLGLDEKMLLVPNTAESAKNRYIYYPDRLTKLPTGLWAAVKHAIPMLQGGFGGFFLEPFRRRRAKDKTDESVAEFFTRRVNKEIVDNLVSAGLHGIYAGDAYQLSMRSLFPKQWRNELEYGSVIMSALKGSSERLATEAILIDELLEENRPLLTKMKGASVYTLQGGLERLVTSLKNRLSRMPNVTIRTGYKVDRITEDDLKSLKISNLEGETQEFSNVISTLYAPVTNALLPTEKWIPELGAVKAVTVMVVNLYYKEANILPVRGFGYLIPRSISEEQNPEKALGVIFDSDTAADMKPLPPTETLDSVGAGGTTLTVMMGGHYWYGREKFPTAEEAIAMAKAVVKRHLKIEAEPLLTNAALQRNCIPQYTVGYNERMAQAHKSLVENYNGRLAVTGSSYAGVGLSDCVCHARDVAMGLFGKRKRADAVAYTGLEKFVLPEEYVPTSRA